MTFVNSRHLRLVYHQEGQGTHRLVFLHGLAGRRDFWQHQIDEFAEDYEVVSFDLLGHGESSPVPGRSVVADNVAILLEWLRRYPKPTTVIGHSMGGILVNELIGHDPSLVQFVFIDSPCLAQSTCLASYNQVAQQILDSPDPKAFVRAWFGDLLLPGGDPQVRVKVVAEALKASPQWLAEVMAGLTKPGKREPRSVLIIEGNQHFPAGNPLSWLQFYGTADHWRANSDGHFCFLEQPRDVNRKIKNFLTQMETFQA